jgi:hypothetical protein
MDKIENLDHKFMIALFFTGIVLISVSSSIIGELDQGCSDKKIRSGMTALMAFGAIFTTAPIAFAICNSSRNCSFDGNKLVIYIGLTLAFLLIIIGICSSILDQFNKNSKKCGGSKVKSYIVLMLVTSVFAFIGLVFLSYVLYKDMIL